VTERAIQPIALLTVLSIAPSILVMMTSFTRIVVVLSLLRTAMGTATTPPNSVIIALAMFLTAMGMMMLPPVVVSLPFKLIFSCSSTAGHWLREASCRATGVEAASPAHFAGIGSSVPLLQISTHGCPARTMTRPRFQRKRGGVWRFDSIMEPRSDSVMLSRDDDKPTARSGQRKGKAEQPGRKGEQRNRKAAPQQNARADSKADSLQRAPEASSKDIREQASAPVSSADKSATPAAPAVTSPAGSVETSPVNFQTVANAYGDFSRKSLEQTRSFFEKLAGVRSFGKALELQTEFAREAYETFVTESRRIGELHGQLAAQRLKRLEGLMVRMSKPF
jgi:hypothetical protein